MKNIKDWEEEFEKLWGKHLINTPMAKEMKTFICRLLSLQKQEIMEEIEQFSKTLIYWDGWDLLGKLEKWQKDFEDFKQKLT